MRSQLSLTTHHRDLRPTFQNAVRLFVVLALALVAQLGVQLASGSTASAQEAPEVPNVVVRTTADGSLIFSWLTNGAASYNVATPGAGSCTGLDAEGGSTQVPALVCSPDVVDGEVCVAVQAVRVTGEKGGFSALTCVDGDHDPFNLGTSYINDRFTQGAVRAGEQISSSSDVCVADLSAVPVRYVCVQEAERQSVIDGLTSSTSAEANEERLFWIGEGGEVPLPDYEFRVRDAVLGYDGMQRVPRIAEPGDLVTATYAYRNLDFQSPDDIFDAAFESKIPAGVELRRYPTDVCSYISFTLVCKLGDIEFKGVAEIEVDFLISPDAEYEDVRILSRALRPDGWLAADVKFSSNNLLSRPRDFSSALCGLCQRPDDNDRRQATTFSHPNLVTFDARRYIFHGAGDYVLAESTQDEFAIHVRFSRMDSTTVSFNQAIAAQVGNTVVSFGDDDESGAFAEAVVRVDGVAVEVRGNSLNIENKATLSLVNGQYQLLWNDGTVLFVGTRVADPWSIELSEPRWGTVQGLLGDGDGDQMNDLVARTGEPFNYNSMELYEIFGASWILDADTTLFRSDLRAIDRLPIIPSAVITLADLPAEDVARADELCRDGGVQPGAGLSECIFDVALTGDLRWIYGLGVVGELVNQSVSVLAERGLIEDDTTLTGPAVLNGSIDAVGATDVYRLQLEAGAVLTATVNDLCTNPATFEFALEAPSGVFIARSEGELCGEMGVFDLPETGEYKLRVYDTNGFLGGYQLTVALPNSTISELELNTVVSGSLSAGDEALYVLDFDQDDARVYFQGGGFTCGSLRVEITTPFGQVLGDQRCSNAGTIPLTTGTWIVRVYSPIGSDDADYSLALWIQDPADPITTVYGQAFTGSIDRPYNYQEYIFEVPADDTRVFVSAACDSAIRLDIRDSAGEIVGDRIGCFGGGLVTLDAGTYRLRAAANRLTFGDYSFTLTLPPDREPIAYTVDEQANIQFAAPGERVFVEFTVGEDTEAFFDWIECSVADRVLTDQFGTVVYQDSETCADFSQTLSAGNWTLTLTSTRQQIDRPIRFRIWDLPERQTFTYALDEIASGSLTFPTDAHTYSLTITEPTDVYFEPLGCQGNSHELRLVSPQGETAIQSTCGNRGEQVLLQPGEWKIIAFIRTDRLADYQFRVIDVSDLPETQVPYELETRVTGSFTIPTESIGYIFDVTEPTEVRFNSEVCTFQINWELIDPQGTVVNDTSCYQTFVADLTPGTWQLRVYSLGNTGSFAFSTTLQPPESEFTYAIGDIIEGSLGFPFDGHRYNFEVPAEGITAFISLQDCGNQRWQLLNPAGIPIRESFCRNGVDVDLVEGSYTVRIYTIGTEFGEYRLESFDLTGRQPFEFPLTLDTPVANAFEFPLDVHVYSFDVAANTTEVYKNIDFNRCLTSATYELVNPFGTTSKTGRLCQGELLDVGAPGTWQIRATAQGAVTGSYEFALLAVGDRPTERPYVVGDEESGSLYERGETVDFNFDIAEPNTKLWVEMLDSCFSSSPYGDFAYLWSIVDSVGTTVASAGCGEESRVTLNAGSYTYRVRSDSSSLVEFAFRIVPLPAVEDIAASIDAGVEIVTELLAGQRAVYTFDVPADGLYEIRPLNCNSSSPWSMALSDPSGSFRARAQCPPSPFELGSISRELTAGQWTVEIDGRALVDMTTSFIVYAPIEDQPAGAYQIGAFESNEITSPRSSLSYDIEIASDVYAYFKSESCFPGGTWELLDETRSVRTASCDGDFEYPLSPGSWTLRVASTTQDTGAFSFQVWDITERSGEVILTALDEDLIGSFSFPKQEIEYEFEVVQDATTVFVAADNCESPEGARWSWTLRDDLSRFVGNGLCGQSRQVTLNAGTYTLRVVSRGDLIPYSIRAWNLTGAVAGESDYQVGADATGVHDTPGDVDNFNFTLTETSRVVLEGIACDGLVEFDVLDAIGTQIQSAECDQSIGFDLAPGDWTIRARSTSAEFGSYRFRLWGPLPEDQAAAYTIGTEVSGALAFPTEVHRFTFEVAGSTKSFVVQPLSCTADAPWRVRFGDEVAGLSAHNIASDCTAPSVITVPPGTHTVEISAPRLSSADYGFRMDELPVETSFPYTPGDYGVGVLTDSAHSHTFQVAADSTVELRFSGCRTTSWQLLNPDGDSLAGAGCLFEPLELVLAPGEWTMRLEPDRSDFGTRDYIAYAFQIEEQA